MVNFPLSDSSPTASCRVGQIVYRFICPDFQSIPKRFGNFDNIRAHVVLLELASRDKPRTRDVQAKCLNESFKTLLSVAESVHCKESDIILLLDGINVFKEELSIVPLAHHFPDFKGGEDYSAACDYLLDRFLAVLPNNGRRVYTHFWDSALDDTNSSTGIRFVMGAVQDIMIDIMIRCCYLDPTLVK